MPHGNLIATAAAAMAGRPVGLAWNIRQSLYDLRDEKLATQWIIRALKGLSGRPDAILYNSHQARAHHEALGFAPAHGRVIPNGFNTGRWKPDVHRRAALRSALGIGDAAPLAGFVGRFHALKDVPAFMEAAAIAMAENPQLHFVMVGDGLARDNAALTPLFAALPPQRFHALGPRDDIEAILPAMDFFCLSSISEAFPNVVGEAMASGLPCIATDVGDCARLIDGHGRIVPRGDPAAMAAAISDLARMDVARRAEIGKAARARIEAGYSLRATVDAYTQLYDSMMKRDV
jgi:glycosyltransferase involved in cell wall biosynthesis